MIKVETLAEFEQAGYKLATWCPTCKRHGPLIDPRRYVDRGKGGMKPSGLRIRHRECGTLLEIRVQAAKGYGK